MKQSPTMNKVLILFFLASWNLSVPGCVDCVTLLALSTDYSNFQNN